MSSDYSNATDRVKYNAHRHALVAEPMWLTQPQAVLAGRAVSTMPVSVKSALGPPETLLDLIEVLAEAGDRLRDVERRCEVLEGMLRQHDEDQRAVRRLLGL